LLIEDPDSKYHEDVIEDVQKEVAAIIRKRISDCFPEIKSARIEVNFSFGLGEWGEGDYEEIEF
jgi:hypothetical protein